MKHSEFKPHAAITLSNSGGIEIMLNRSNDGLYYRFNYGQDNLETDEILEAEILHNEQGEPYFLHMNSKLSGQAYFLNEAIRTS